MTKYLSNRDGGGVDEKGLYYFLDKLFPGEVITGLDVTQQTSPTLGVKVNVDANGAAAAMIPSGNDYPYHVFMDAAENVALATADGSNPRIDLIVGYIDLSVQDDTNPNNPGAFLIDNVTGVPAGSPTVPNDAAIHAVIGAGNPYAIFARVAVAAVATTITNANITDVRSLAQLPAAKLSTSAITLGYVERTTEFTTTSATYTDVTTLSVTVTVPSGGRRIRITTEPCYISNTNSGVGVSFAIAEGATLLKERIITSPGANFAIPASCIYVSDTAPSAGSHTYKVQLRADAGTAKYFANPTAPAFLHVELV